MSTPKEFAKDKQTKGRGAGNSKRRSGEWRGKLGKAGWNVMTMRLWLLLLPGRGA